MPYPTTLSGQFRRHGLAYLLGALLLFIQQGMMYARDRLFQQGVDAATSDRYHAALRVTTLALSVIVSAALVRTLSRRVLFNAGRQSEYELRTMLLARLHLLGPSFFRKIPTGDIMSRATNDLGQLRLVLGFGALNVINTLFGLISALSIMLGISVRLTLASLASAPLLMLITRWFSRQLYIRNRANQEALGAMSDRVQASLAGVRVVRALSLEDGEMSRFERTCTDYLEKSLGLARLRGLFGPVLGLVSAIGVLVIFWYGGTMVISGLITPGQFVAFWVALNRLIWPLLALGFVMSIIQRGRASYERLRVIFEATPDVIGGDASLSGPVRGALQVKHLSYSVGEQLILADISFDLPAGGSLAIVGKTGSGKSTLATLLPRLLPTPPGTVFLDGVDVCELPLSVVRGAIGYAQQDAFLFSTTVAHNAGFALAETDSSEARLRIRRACDDAQILPEVERLVDGFDTVVGERGIQLSGGQRQRVALARAFLREPPILLLDDPLSAVDARTEARILEAIDKQARQRTLLLITHRVAAASRCDSILVLDHGRVVEKGTHAELAAAGGIYSKLVEEQRLESELDHSRDLDGDVPATLSHAS